MSGRRVIVTSGDDPILSAALALRDSVLYEPFGIDPGDRDEASAREGVHAVVIEGERVAGYGRLVPSEAGWRLRQVAVDPSMQGSGIGTLVVRALLRQAARSGEHRIWLAAREPAVGFYEALGFAVVEEDYPTPTGMRHVRMVLATGLESDRG